MKLEESELLKFLEAFTDAAGPYGLTLIGAECYRRDYGVSNGGIACAIIPSAPYILENAGAWSAVTFNEWLHNNPDDSQFIETALSKNLIVKVTSLEELLEKLSLV